MIMKATSLAEAILLEVDNRQGCKATELVTEIVAWAISNNVEFTPDSVIDLIDTLVRDKKLVEIEYTLPSMGWRVKSFLLPANTEVTIND